MRKNVFVAGIFLAVTAFGLAPRAHADDPVPTVPIVSIVSGYQLQDWNSSDWFFVDSGVYSGNLVLSSGAATEETASAIGGIAVAQAAAVNSSTGQDQEGFASGDTGGETSGRWVWQGTNPPDVDLVFGYQAQSSGQDVYESSAWGASFTGHSKNAISGPGSYDETYYASNSGSGDPNPIPNFQQVDVHHEGTAGSIEFYLSTRIDALAYTLGASATAGISCADAMDVISH